MKLKIALAAISVILTLSLIANAYFYNQQTSIVTRKSALENQATELRSEISSIQNETAELQNQLNQLNQEGGSGPRLVTRLGARELRVNYPGQDLRLSISGEVWNVGMVAAYNCRVNVTLYRQATVVKSELVELGTIESGGFKDVSTNVYYAGDPLSNWTLIPGYD